MLSDEAQNPLESHRANPGWLVMFGLIWLGEGFLILTFVKWTFHISAALYFLMIPWALLGVAMGWVILMRPKSIMEQARAMQEKEKRDSERLGKWTPPGFP